MAKKNKEVKQEKVEVLAEDTTKVDKQQDNTVKETDINKVMEDLNNQIINLEKERDDLINKVKLAQADLVNYRVRKDEEVAGLLKYANKDLIVELLPIVDNFERAIINQKEDVSDDIKKYYDGIKMIHTGLVNTLHKFEVVEINNVGGIFNPLEEEAILIGNEEGKEDEEVLEVFQVGYKLKDRVIRPARVKINQK